MTTRSNYETLGVEVTVLQKEMGEVKTNVGLLSGKIDAAVNDLGRDMRRAIDALGTTINERGRTPWAVIWAGLSVMIILMGFIANQTLAPINSELAMLRSAIVPRAEHVVRDENITRRITDIEAAMRVEAERRYTEITKQYDRLYETNKDERQNNIKEMQSDIRDLRRILSEGKARP